MSNPKLQTHFYDNECVKIKLPSVNISKDEMILVLSNLQNYIVNDIARNAIQLIISDIGQSANFDHTKDIWVENLLYEICINPCLKDCLPIIEEQLADIILSGQCAQGRVTRLLQVYLSII